MKVIVFGDEETVIMFHLIGVDGVIHEQNDPHFDDKFNKLLEDPEIGIIIITEQILIKYKDYILPIKLQRRIPIIIEIPSILLKFHEDFVRDIVKKFIGIEITE